MTAQSKEVLPSTSAASARAWWALVVLSVGAILSYTDRQILTLLVDPIRADLSLSDTQVSVLQGLAFGIVYAVAGLAMGRLADIVSRRWLIAAGVAVWSMATIACGFADSFWVLFTARLFVGLGEAVLSPAAISVIADYFPPQRRATAVGIYLMGVNVGAGTAIVLGGTILEAAIGGVFQHVPVLGGLAPWRSTFVLVGVPGLILALLMSTVREPARGNRIAARSEETSSLRMIASQLWALRAVLLPLYAAIALTSLGDYTIYAWIPALLSRLHAFSPGQVAATLGPISVVAGSAGALLGGLLADASMKYRGGQGRIEVALIAVAVAVLGSCVAWATSSTQVLLCTGLWMLMSSLALVAAMATLQDLIPNEVRGLAVALLYSTVTVVGLALGPTLAAILTDRVYRDPLAVGVSITTVTLPAILLAVLCYLRARHAVRTPRNDSLPSVPQRLEAPGEPRLPRLRQSGR